jgi:CheY-like chemotaxis protein
VLSLRGSTQWHLPLVLLTRTGQVDSKFMRSNGMTEAVPRPISLVTLRRYRLPYLYYLSLYISLYISFDCVSSCSTFERLLGLQTEKAEPYGGPRQTSEATRFSSGENVQHTDILLVDDNVVNQKILANILKQMGLDYDIASDGKQAVEAHAAHPRKVRPRPYWYSFSLTLPQYGVILMDTMMPVMDGFEAAREIRRREHGTGRHVPIIAVTGIAAVDQRFVGKSENAEAECIRSGMDECTFAFLNVLAVTDGDTQIFRSQSS